jgi:hypothetical protein
MEGHEEGETLKRGMKIGVENCEKAASSLRTFKGWGH